MVAKVFISHSIKDQKITAEVHRWLVAQHHEVFLDQHPHDGIEIGDEWQQRLYERLRWADAVVFVVTSAFLASPWCTQEVACAQARDSRLLPVRAEPKIDHPLLRSVHHVDLTEDPTAAREVLLAALRRVDAAGGLGWADDRSPFPGLRPFDVEDHRVFFGRSGEVQQLAGLLRSPTERAEKAVLLVVGPSGCGKSSLVRAGLLHVMAEAPGWWTLPPILPGTDPAATLVTRLAASAQQLHPDWTVAKVRHQLVDHGLTGLADELLQAAGASRLLVVVDQFEELLTQTPHEQRVRFAQLLGPALGGPVQVVATLRPEFLNQLLTDSDLAGLPTCLHTLRPLHRDALRAVIEGPAKLAGIAVDDELVTRLVADTDSGEALPLLAFTLFQLAEGIRRGGRLSTARYDQLGGVRGALTHQADAALADATAATGRRDKEVIAGLLRLVTVDEQGQPTRWRVPRAELPEPVTRELDAFVTRRLLTTDHDTGKVAVVGVAHEAFLSAWPPLAQEIEKNKTALRARREVEQAATKWNDHRRPAFRLWERGRLAAAVADTGARIQANNLVTDHVDLSPTARIFLRDSIRRDRIQRGRIITVLSVLLVLALVAAGIAVFQQRAAKEQRDAAVSRQVAEQATGLRTTNPALAAQLSLAAYQLVPTAEAHGSLLSTFASPYAARLTDHISEVYEVAFSPDMRTLATSSSDKTVRLWDIRASRHPSPLSILTGHNGGVRSVAFSPDGRTLATTSDDSTTRLWDASNLRQPHPLSTLTDHAGGWSVAFSPDGRTLATTSSDSTAQLWDISNSRQPRPLSTLTGHTSGVWSMAFSPDGHTLATGSADNTARLWDFSNPHQPKPLGTLTGHTSGIHSVAFNPDGHTLATGSADSTARLWDISDSRQPRLLSALTGHTKPIHSVAFSLDNRTLATGSADNTTRLWDVHEPGEPHLLDTLHGHSNTVISVAFSADRRTLATASLDHTAQLWDLPGPVVAGHTKAVSSVAFRPDKHTLATGSLDRPARLWDISDSRRPEPLGAVLGRTGDVSSVAFSPDGRILVTSSIAVARLWDISNPHQPHPLGTLTGHGNGILSVAFSPDGGTLATSSYESAARLWDISNPPQPEQLSSLTGHQSGINSVTFSPDGHTLATGSADDTARLWDISKLRDPVPLGVLDDHTKNDVRSVAFSLDGHTLAIGSADTTARLWDISNPHQPKPLSTLTGHRNGVNSVAFSPDGHTLATGSADATARLWDISNPHQPKPLGTLTGHTSGVNSVTFSPDGHTLATGSADTTARLWETNVKSVVARICRITPDITKDKWAQYLPDFSYRPPCLQGPPLADR